MQVAQDNSASRRVCSAVSSRGVRGVKLEATLSATCSTHKTSLIRESMPPRNRHGHGITNRCITRAIWRTGPAILFQLDAPDLKPADSLLFRSAIGQEVDVPAVRTDRRLDVP